jgi:hypothetical protein
MAVLGQTRMLNAPAVSKPFGSLPFQLRVFFRKQNTQLSTVKAFETFAAVKTVGPDCIITSKLTRRSNVRALCG